MSAINQAKPISAAGRAGKSLRSSELLLSVLRYAILIVLAATWVFPFYWMFSSALKDDSQVYTIPPVLVPNPAHWNNFIDAWTHNNFNLYAFNSIVYYCIPVTVLTVVSSTIVAYGFARLKWAGRDLLFAICLATLMIPYQVTLVALFRFLWAWNDYLGPLIYLNQEHLYPLALGIDRLRSTISATGAQVLAYPYLMAVSTIVVAPVLLLFFFAQRTFIEGISVTGIKG